MLFLKEAFKTETTNQLDICKYIPCACVPNRLLEITFLSSFHNYLYIVTLSSPAFDYASLTSIENYIFLHTDVQY